MTDVLIIGGGIVGMTTALALAESGAGVTIVDKGRLGEGSSSLNAGGIRSQFFKGPNIEAANRTKAWLRGFESETGVDLEYNQNGYLFLVTSQAQADRLAEGVAIQNAHGADTRMISRAETEALLPHVNLDGVIGGCFGPTDGHLNPRVLMPALAEKVRRSNITVLEDRRVLKLVVDGEKVTGVETDQGVLSAGIVVTCAGAWSVGIGRTYGQELPILPRRSQVFVMEETPEIPEDAPHTFDFDAGIYVRRAGKGIWSGAAFKPVLDEVPDVVEADWTEGEELARRLAVRVPSLAGRKFERNWAGPIEVTPDDNPLIGFSTFENYFLATGFSGHGMCIGPGLAEDIAAAIQGKTPQTDLSIFRPERFTDGGEIAKEGMWLAERPASFSIWAAREWDDEAVR
ncbi:NAD(P)/FAD-dependent oxidoreductase [Kineosporia babensis]|uniref:FAD-binding oxidoreductase n=1 Tax=Kineosporia babensis TaxID=499548 RepID=A0A9X1N8Z2_9ACTN|nr:FAD-binding oxidoreductase [Kineosporia babensis]MCD5310597.1 FAD-binding oxidoreductase [Kineosporia babensis]